MKKLARAAFAFAGALAVASCTGQNGSNTMIPTGSGPASPPNVAAQSPPSFGHQANVRPLCGPVAVLGQARCFALVRSDAFFSTADEARNAVNAASTYPGPLDPAHLQQAYNLPSKTAGSNQTVGIVDAYSDPTAQIDLANYRNTFGLGGCTKTDCSSVLTILNQKGSSSPLPKPNPGWAGEISLDLDMVSAVCPNCKIVLVEANTSSSKDLGVSVAAAQKAGAGQISNSYGGPECIVTKSGKMICGSPLPLAKYYNLPNTIVTASSGDNTWFAGPQSPADYTTVVAVGGTSIYPYASGRGWFETAWTGAGSSCSKYVKAAGWQKGIGCPGGMRAIADVSAVADPYTGVLVYETYPGKRGGFYVYGGTSVASPVIAGVYALAGNASTTNAASSLYHAPKGSLNDVIVGKNGIPGIPNDAGQQCGVGKGSSPITICVSGTGWDGPSGLGTPNGLKAF